MPEGAPDYSLTGEHAVAAENEVGAPPTHNLSSRRHKIYSNVKDALLSYSYEQRTQQEFASYRFSTRL